MGKRNIHELIVLPEGLEFKAEVPFHADIVKTIVALANDTGKIWSNTKCGLGYGGRNKTV